MRTRLICLGAVACAAALAQPAAAQVQPAGTGEPAFTNSASNTQFFEWPAQPTGIDAYQVQYRYYANNAEVASPTVNYGTGPGNTWANWSGVATLQHGGQYGICAQGRYSFTNDPLFFPDGPNSCSAGTMIGRRAHTTIDRSKPTAAITLAGGAAYTRDAKVPLKVDFSDDVAGPFPANFICFQYGGGPTGLCDNTKGYIYGYTSACSVPGTAGKSTSFNCTADYGAGSSPAPDGMVWACVRAADAAIPDNPNSANQSGSAEKANLSDPACDGVVLDRTAPAATITAAGTAKVGELVSFQAQVTDATSGVAGQTTWTWGDNTAGGSGAAATHTFTQAGTYEVRVNVADNAGNPGTATKVITVSAPSDGGTTTPGGGTTTPGGGTTTPGGGTTTPGGGTTTPGGDTTTPDDEGTPDDDETTPDDEAPAPKLALSAPRKLAAKAKAIRVALTANASGRVQLALVRGGRIVSRGGTAVVEGTSAYKLKLPKGTKAGRYAIKATYSPTRGAARTATRAITLTGKTGAKRARLASRPGSTVDGGPVGMPDGTFHGRKPARMFAVR